MLIPKMEFKIIPRTTEFIISRNICNKCILVRFLLDVVEAFDITRRKGIIYNMIQYHFSSYLIDHFGFFVFKFFRTLFFEKYIFHHRRSLLGENQPSVSNFILLHFFFFLNIKANCRNWIITNWTMIFQDFFFFNNKTD